MELGGPENEPVPQCPNCEAALADGFYCQNCGQSRTDPRVAVSTWLRTELVEELLSLESKLIRTLWLLVARPGSLSLEWKSGRRARYVAPLRLYLIVSAVLLAVSFLSGLVVIDIPPARALAGTEHALAYAAAQGAFEAQVRLAVALSIIVLVPLVAAVMKVVNVGTGGLLVDHLVFALHCLTLVALCAGLLWQATQLDFDLLYYGSQVTPVLLVGYLALALRRMWALSWASTAVRTAGAVLVLGPVIWFGGARIGQNLGPSIKAWMGVYHVAVAIPAYEQWHTAHAESGSADVLLREALTAYQPVMAWGDLRADDINHDVEMLLALPDYRFAWAQVRRAVHDAPEDLLALGRAWQVGLEHDSVVARDYLERFTTHYPTKYGEQLAEHPIHAEELEHLRELADAVPTPRDSVLSR